MNLTQQHQRDIASNQGALPPDLAAQLLESMGEGETVVIDTDTAAAPSAAPAKEQAAAPATPAAAASADVPTDDLNADNAVILAKDGLHTIAYDKLVEAREAAQAAKQSEQAAQAALREANAKLAALQQTPATATAATPAADAAAAPTAVDIDKLERDWLDAVNRGDDDAALGMRRQINAEIQRQATAAATAASAAAVAPLAKQREVDAIAEHRQAILSAHPDAVSIVHSRELRAWIDSQPTFVRQGFDDVLENGSAAQVNELFDAYKKAAGISKPAADVAAAAAAAIARAKDPLPNSLTDIPGGRPGATASREEVMAALDGPQMIDALADLRPDQIETFMNRRV